MSGFYSLHPVVQHHIVSTLGWPGLRPLQEASVDPLLSGSDAILLAPTAGGKTEAAVFPLLTRMVNEDWSGVSVLYVCPLKALLNNLENRLSMYAAWVGQTVAVWHGEVRAPKRKRILRDRPNILLTTPESLECMMVSTSVQERQLFEGLRAVIVDEVHAFAADDRGWHLSAVLARLEATVGRPLQRIGMSATVGNPEALLGWLQGGTDRTGTVINPKAAAPAEPEIVVDLVEDISKIAILLSKLHRGEKRLVFVDSRRRAEELAHALQAENQSVFLSHSSLSISERQRSERAFANERDCFIVATSTLELGIDIGDLDRVIQLGTPRTVSSFLQRLGRTGRRPGTVRNCLFISTDEDDLLHTLGMLQAWARGYVEPVTPPPVPRHLAAQQFLAAALSNGAFRISHWEGLWKSTALMTEETLEMDPNAILEYLLNNGFLERDGDLAFIGQSAEEAFGRRHFMELLSAFTTTPVFTVVDGRREIGTVENRILTQPDDDRPLVLALAGRNWLVSSIDWRAHRVYVEQTDHRGIARWGFLGPTFGYTVSRCMRDVLLGSLPDGIHLTRRASEGLSSLLLAYGATVSDSPTVFLEGNQGPEWWTWAGGPRNQAMLCALGSLADQGQRVDHSHIRLLPGATPDKVLHAIRAWESSPPHDRPVPEVNKVALRELKFSAALPAEWAAYAVGRRLISE